MGGPSHHSHKGVEQGTIGRVLFEHPWATWELTAHSSLHCTKHLYALGPSQLAQQRTGFVSRVFLVSIEQKWQQTIPWRNHSLVDQISSIVPKTTQITFIDLGCPPELSGKTILVKIPHTHFEKWSWNRSRSFFWAVRAHIARKYCAGYWEKEVTSCLTQQWT